MSELQELKMQYATLINKIYKDYQECNRFMGSADDSTEEFFKALRKNSKKMEIHKKYYASMRKLKDKYYDDESTESLIQLVNLYKDIEGELDHA